jgi:hypothetical protein
VVAAGVLGFGAAAGAVTVWVTTGAAAGAFTEPHAVKPIPAANAIAGIATGFTLFASVSFILFSSREECGCCVAPGPGACFGGDFLIEGPAPVPPGLFLIAGRLQPSGALNARRAAAGDGVDQPRNSGHESFAMNSLL